MPDTSQKTIRTVAWPTYFVALLLIVLPAMDYLTNIIPISPWSLEWRYGSVGLLSGFFLTPLLALLVAHVTATAFKDRPALLVLFVVNTVGAVALLGITGLFLLDTLQLRAGIAEASSVTFHIGAAKAAIKEVGGVVAMAWLGFAEWQTLKGLAKAKKVARASSEPPMLMGSAESARLAK